MNVSIVYQIFYFRQKFFIDFSMISPPLLFRLIRYIDDIAHRTPGLTQKTNCTKTEYILTSLACLTEEVGEVATEVRKLTKCSFSQKKCDSFQMTDLEDEVVDVLITTLLLARSVGLDSLDEAIERKIRKNQERGY